MKDIEINVWFDGGNKVFKIEGRPGQEPSVQTIGVIDGNALAGCSCILEVARCLLREQNINHFFNPTLNHEAGVESLVQCRWLRSGKLLCIGEATKKFLHATTIEEALSRKRSFTCTRTLLQAMPLRRPALPRPRTKKEKSDAVPQQPENAEG